MKHANSIETAFDWIATDQHMVLFEQRTYLSEVMGKVFRKLIVRVYEVKSDKLAPVPYFEHFEFPLILCSQYELFERQAKISLKEGNFLMVARYGMMVGSRRMEEGGPSDRLYFPDIQRPQII